VIWCLCMKRSERIGYDDAGRGMRARRGFYLERVIPTKRLAAPTSEPPQAGVDVDMPLEVVTAGESTRANLAHVVPWQWRGDVASAVG